MLQIKYFWAKTSKCNYVNNCDHKPMISQIKKKTNIQFEVRWIIKQALKQFGDRG